MLSRVQYSDKHSLTHYACDIRLTGNLRKHSRIPRFVNDVFHLGQEKKLRCGRKNSVKLKPKNRRAKPARVLCLTRGPQISCSDPTRLVVRIAMKGNPGTSTNGLYVMCVTENYGLNRLRYLSGRCVCDKSFKFLCVCWSSKLNKKKIVLNEVSNAKCFPARKRSVKEKAKVKTKRKLFPGEDSSDRGIQSPFFE